jgi:hypothetical protein
MGSYTLTNNYALPEALVRAILNDGYSRGKSDISVTQLLVPPYQRKMMATLDRIEDVSSRIASLMGQIGHAIAERGALPTDIIEERLFTKVNDWVVSGQFDLIEPHTKTMRDYKFTSVWSYVLGGKTEWEDQLNFLRVLAHRHAADTGDDRYRVEKLEIVAIFRDWVKSKAGSDNYPPVQAVTIDIPVWPIEEAERRLLDRVKAHQVEDPAPCSDEERWATDPVYAVMKKGRKSAVKLMSDKESADQMVKDNGKDHYVEFRPQTFRRCEGYCSIGHACPHHNSNAQGAF